MQMEQAVLNELNFTKIIEFAFQFYSVPFRGRAKACRMYVKNCAENQILEELDLSLTCHLSIKYLRAFCKRFEIFLLAKLGLESNKFRIFLSSQLAVKLHRK